MDETFFVDRVKKHFSYLESDYGFKLTAESNSDVRPQSDGKVEYTSDSVVLVIDSETGYAAVWFYRIKDGREYDLDPVAIHEFLNTNDMEKRLLLSTDPQDQSIASRLFHQKFLLNQPEWESGGNTILEKLEIRLGNYAKWLKEHAKFCLTGDFSHWIELHEYKTYRARADHLRQGKDETGYARVKNTDGNWILVKQSIFKEKLEYIERLKQEFSK